MDDKRSHTVWIAAAMLMLLPMLYVGSYLVLVRPWAILIPVPNEPSSYHISHYRYGGAYAEAIYWPLEQLDRRIRAETWGEPIFH